MTELNQIYKCNVCENIVEALHNGVGKLVCCDKPMELLIEKTEKDEGQEKHVPVIEILIPNETEGNKEGVIVKVGSVPHPMEEKHYIEWVQIITEKGNYSRKFLKPGDKPELKFPVKAKNIRARIYCNIHGLWKS